MPRGRLRGKFRSPDYVTSPNHAYLKKILGPSVIYSMPTGRPVEGPKPPPFPTNWNKAPLRLWQTQLNFAMSCAPSACGVSSEHLNYAKRAVEGKVQIT